ncbi:MAG: branched-chain amino acid transport system II carrier protein [Rickettsiaceae bacterium]|nr:branched-chain amino acid transport system II carrier protein [Rickettsiaceae bacterium]
MRRKILLYGLAIFAMFFGSGNLVYPLSVGIHSLDNWYLGYLGFFATSVILPFLGLFVVKLYRGNYFEFFGEAGKIAKFVLPLLTLSLLGSFGVVPRCITVAHGGLEYLYPQISLTLFSFIFCLCCYLFCLKDQWMFQILGKLLTPILLTFITILIIFGIYNVDYAIPTANLTSTEIFKYGFLEGYNTMDLLSAFFFSALIFKQIEQIVPDQINYCVVRTAIKPSIIGASLLAVIYLGFVYLGAAYSDVAKDLDPELVLPAISSHVLGEAGSLVISFVIILSCLTTAVALNKIYAEYLADLFKLNKRNQKYMLIATTIIAFLFSTLDFTGIAIILVPVLQICYPALIMLTIISIIAKGHKRFKTIAFYFVILLMLFMT